MSKIYLAFLWHMHQPYYLVGNELIMPWVRLHGIKGYYDMPSVIEEFPGTKATFNLTPSLVKQIQVYQTENVRDIFEEVSRKPVKELNPIEKAFILKHFFMSNWETMVQVNPDYSCLLHKRGRKRDINIEERVEHFTDQEYHDLQVWFNLSWFGFKALEKFPVLKELRKKGRDFSEEDKETVLALQKQILKELIPLYKKLWEEGKIEVSISPFYHPILPLVFDTELAKRTKQDIKLPPRFHYPQDALAQIKNGVSYIEEIIGKKPKGMWPSEGSVAEELIPLWQESGIMWVATDEGILFKTLSGAKRDEILYQPYRVRYNNSEVTVLFRDREISDLIGFTYHQMPPEVAVEDFIRHLDLLRKKLARRDQKFGLCLVALDGENPWEWYENSGEKFLRRLYPRLLKEDWLEMVTISEYLERHPPDKILESLATGSWIRGNFEIWIGEPEENKAWEYLGKVRKELEPELEIASPELKKEAFEAIYAAEGSDWFWWYGDDFSSASDMDFDEIFRLHLKRAYQVLGKEPPLFLDEPVIFDHPVKLATKPLGFISPVLDGKVTSFYEWQEAGLFDLEQVLGARYIAEPIFSKLFFGFDLFHLYLRLDLYRERTSEEELEVEFRFIKPLHRAIVFPFHLERQKEQNYIIKIYDNNEKTPAKFKYINKIRKDKIIELAVDFEELGFKPKDEVWFRVRVLLKNNEVDRYPRSGFISFSVPDEEFETRMWSV